MEEKYGYYCLHERNIVECNEVETRTVYVSVGCDITWEIVEVLSEKLNYVLFTTNGLLNYISLKINTT